MTRIRIAVLMLLAILASSRNLKVHGGDGFFRGRQRARATNHLPNYAYGQSTWPFTSQNRSRDSAIAVAATDPTRDAVNFKPFHFRATALHVDYVSLREVGLMLDRARGKMIASGRLEHSGSDDGLIGSNVTVRVQVYASPVGATLPQRFGTDALPTATPNDVNQLPPDSSLIGTFERKFWVSRGQSTHVSLMDPCDKRLLPKDLRHYFDRITHVRVELEYQKDR